MTRTFTRTTATLRDPFLAVILTARWRRADEGAAKFRRKKYSEKADFREMGVEAGCRAYDRLFRVRLQ